MLKVKNLKRFLDILSFILKSKQCLFQEHWMGSRIHHVGTT